MIGEPMTRLEQEITNILQEEFQRITNSKYPVAVPASAVKRIAQLIK
jgi:hypothetical protein